MDSELASINEKSSTELEIMNDENNAGLITSSINLTEEVKSIFDGLVIEQFNHENYQSDCFDKLIKIWIGENLLVTGSILDINKETEKFDNDCKAYILQAIAKYLPEEDKVLYSSYKTFRITGNIVVNCNGACTIYHKDQIDANQYRDYIRIINKKILKQYNNIKHNFGVYLTEKLEEAEFYKLYNDPVLFQLRRSQRITKIIDFKPMLESTNSKKKKRTIIDFLKTNTTSNTASKKRKVNPFNDLYLQYIFDCLRYIS